MASIERKVNKVNKQKLHVLQILPIFFGMPHFLGRAQVILIIFYPTCYIKHSAILGDTTQKAATIHLRCQTGASSCHIHNT